MFWLKITKSPVILMLLLSLVSPKTTANLIFTAPPDLPPDVATDVFQPLVEELQTALNQAVEFKYPRDWIEYTKWIQSGMFQVAFDQPHFVAWRSKPGSESLYHRPIVKMTGKLKYGLVVPNTSSFKSLNDLSSKRICAIPSPSLGTVLVLQQYLNPVIQPLLIGTKSDNDSLNKLKSGKCHAAIINEYALVGNDELAATLRVIYSSKAFPNYTLAITPQLQAQDIDAIKQVFNTDTVAEKFGLLFKHYGQETQGFIPTSDEEFDTLNILEGYLFDW